MHLVQKLPTCGDRWVEIYRMSVNILRILRNRFVHQKHQPHQPNAPQCDRRSNSLSLNRFLLSRNNLFFLIISGIATGLSWIFYFKALQIGKVSQVAPVDKMSVAIAIILSVLFLGETLTPKIALGAILIIAGTVVLIL